VFYSTKGATMAQDISDDRLRQLLAEGKSQRAIAKETGLARSTLYRRLKNLDTAPVQQVDTGAAH
jgi:DNA invertase Pin-like site-specific DNA recombinase